MKLALAFLVSMFSLAPNAFAAPEAAPLVKLAYLEDVGGKAETRTYLVLEDGTVKISFSMVIDGVAKPFPIEGSSTNKLSPSKVQTLKVLRKLLQGATLISTRESDCSDEKNGSYFIFNGPREQRVAMVKGCERVLPSNEHARNAATSLIQGLEEALARL